MKKLLISLILLTLILINSTSFAINKEEAKKYLDKDVFLVITHINPLGLYGRIIDVVETHERIYIILDTNYRSGRQLMFLQIKSITYIRERKAYE